MRNVIVESKKDELYKNNNQNYFSNGCLKRFADNTTQYSHLIETLYEQYKTIE